MAQGIEVHHLRGTKEFVPADLAILHVDLSVVPQAYASFAARYPKVLNGTVLDIRKRSFSKLFLQSPEDHHGPVIVKSNLNAGGWPERIHRPPGEPQLVSFVMRVLARACGRLPFSSPGARIFEPSQYEVYPSANLVPSRIYQDSRLIVEKFVPERRGRRYCHRRYYFLGDTEVNQVWLGSHPICANDEDGSDEDAQEVPIPQELRDFRRRMEIDFGKIDYVLGRKGEPIVFDVNKTPFGFCQKPADRPWLHKLCGDLQGGIHAFLPLAENDRKTGLFSIGTGEERRPVKGGIC